MKCEWSRAEPLQPDTAIPKLAGTYATSGQGRSVPPVFMQLGETKLVQQQLNVLMLENANLSPLRQADLEDVPPTEAL